MIVYSHVWIVGAGAVGSALAAELTGAGRAQVVLVGSSVHWATVRARGLRVAVGEAPPVTLRIDARSLESVPALGAQDLVLLAGKLPRLEQTLPVLRGRIGAEAGVIALQNGLRVAEHAGDLLGRPVDRGLVIFGANSPAPGAVILYPGGIRFGRSPVTEAACDLFAGTAIHGTLIDDIPAAEWRKLAINCLANPLAGLLAASNARLGRTDLDPAKEAILREVHAVAAAEGVLLDFSVADFNRYMAGPTGGNTASLRTDIVRGLPTEIGAINGAVVELGQRHGIPTPVNTFVVALIEGLSREAAQGAM
jgi:2-dehydropantoate 2-reductase